MRSALALAAVTLWACGASAAELPSRGVKTKAAPDKVHTCLIDGERGIEAPGGICLRIGGYVSFSAGGGNLKR